jgi:septum formation protein
VLASASPRRRDLLRDAGYGFIVQAPQVDERPRRGEPPEACVDRLARAKARAIRAARGAVAELVLAADTVVVLGQETLGKPRDQDDAIRMLLALAGRVHRVLTGVCLIADDGVELAWVEQSRVAMRSIGAAEARAYAESGEPLDKAGGYALQGRGARFVEAVHGSRSNVIGLPLESLEPRLRALGVTAR